MATEVSGLAVNPTIERKAYELLKESGQDSIPVDPVAIANHLGLEVMIADFDDDTVSGLLRDGVIYANYLESTNRQRFTMAHEIGHYVLHNVTQDVYRSLDAPRDEKEREADAFAAALLMPRHLLTKAIEKGIDTIDALAARFQVSKQSMRIRIRNLGLGDSIGD